MVRDLATDRAGSAQLRAVIDAGGGQDPALWKLVAAELGLTAIAVTERHGGTGGAFVDLAVVLEEAGGALLPGPLLPTPGAGAAAADDEGLAAAGAGGAGGAGGLGGPRGGPPPRARGGPGA